MNRQEFFFSSALFFSVCAISSQQWPGYAAVICVICALLAGICFWRGLVLRTADETAKQIQCQEAARSAWAEKQLLFQAWYETLLHAMEAIEVATQSQRQALTAGIGAVEQVVGRNATITQGRIDEVATRVESSTAQMERVLVEQHQECQANLDQLCKATTGIKQTLDAFPATLDGVEELLKQQHGKQREDLAAVFTLLLNMEKLLKEILSDGLNNGVENITGSLDEFQRKLLKSIEDMRSCIRAEGEHSEGLFDSLCRTLAESNTNQLDRLNEMMQKYEAITKEDLEVFQAVMEA